MERAILGSFRAGIIAVQLDGTVVHLNPIGMKILRGSNLRPGENIHDFAGANTLFRVLSEALTMNYLPTRLEVEIPSADGDSQVIGFTLAELQEQGKRVGICAFFKDLTQVEIAQETENLKRRLLLLGQMAAGLAHEIRNPIASIGVHCGILRNRLSSDEKLISLVKVISDEVGKVDDIIRECLNFVRLEELSLREEKIDLLVGRVVARNRALYQAMEFVVTIPENIEELSAEIDVGLIEQMINNIVVNAVEACERRGRVEISLGFSRHYSDIVKLSRPLKTFLPSHMANEEKFVRIHIRDNGPGIPPDIQEKIFVPFFTTKQSGTGIGLPIAQKIVHSHGGIIDLQSTPGAGTEFIIKIPVSQHGNAENPDR